MKALKQGARYLLIAAISVCAFLLCFKSNILSAIKIIYGSYLVSTKSVHCTGCAEEFIDGRKTQLKAYTVESISPQETDQDLEGLFKTGVLRKITSNSSYCVASLTHSQPYVLPKVDTFLTELSQLYRWQCDSTNIAYHRFTITSFTRSREAIRRLMKVNPNSIEESGHLYGKTIDLSYSHFVGLPKHSDAFVRALKGLRRKKRCYVKFERNGCLHLTVI
jgi:hypothetical protein